MKFSNWRVSHKIGALIAVMAVCAMIVGAIGYRSVSVIDESAHLIEHEGREVHLAIAAEEVLGRLAAAEYRVAADPSAENVRRIQQDIERGRAEIETKFRTLKAISNPDSLRMIAEAEQIYREFSTALEKAVAEANSAGAGVSLSDAQKRLLSNAEHGRALAEKVKEALDRYTARAEAELAETLLTADRTSELTHIILVATTLLGIGSGIVLGYLIARRGIVGPLSSSIRDINALAGGNLHVAIDGEQRRDEMGDIARALRIFRDGLIDAARLREQAAREQEIRNRRAAVLEQAIGSFEKVIAESVGILSSAATELQATARALSATSEETARQSANVGAASAQASSNVQTVASASEELSASISEISRQIASSSTVARQAVEEAGRTNVQIESLAEAADRIGSVVKLISDIAGQTNLLALNATIEAARAGEAGKGFSVVASEVKNLATQTAKATQEITQQIGAIQGATGQSVGAIRGIGSTISKISDYTTMIASAVEQQSAATQEISRNVQQAASGTTEISGNIVGLSQAANDTSASAAQVLASASELSSQSERLRGEVDRFLATVRAA